MTAKTILRTILLIFVVVSGLFLIVKDLRERSQPPAEGSTLAIPSATSATAAENQRSPNSPKVIAYYFHTTYRCSSCRKIEAYSHEAIESGFPMELKDGALQWRVIIVDVVTVARLLDVDDTPLH